MGGFRQLPEVRGLQLPDIGQIRSQAAQRRSFESAGALSQAKIQAEQLDMKLKVTDRLLQVTEAATDQASLDAGLSFLPPQVRASVPLQLQRFSPGLKAQAKALLVPAKLRFQAQQEELKRSEPVALAKGTRLVDPLTGAVKVKAEVEEEKPTTGKIVKFEQIDDSGQVFMVTQREFPGKAPIPISRIPKVSKGERITIDPSTGEVTIERGVGVGGAARGLTKPAKNRVQNDILNAQAGLVRLNKIEQGIEDRFLTIPGKLQITKSKLKAKAGFRLTPEEKKEVQDFSVFAQDSIENINLYIKEITGAQMSEAEADRLRKAVADIGDGLFSGDDPVTFRAKLGNSIQKLKFAAARLNYVNRNGFTIRRDKGGRATGFIDDTGRSIQLDDMPAIMSAREEEIRRQFQAQLPSAAPDEIEGLVLDRLGSEFGLSF